MTKVQSKIFNAYYHQMTDTDESLLLSKFKVVLLQQKQIIFGKIDLDLYGKMLDRGCYFEDKILNTIYVHYFNYHRL